MEIAENKAGEIWMVTLAGRLDAVSSPQLENRLMASIEAGQRKLAVNFTRTDYISSAGLRVLLSSVKRLGSDGQLVLFGLQESVRKVIDIAGFSSVLAIVGSEQEAVDHLS